MLVRLPWYHCPAGSTQQELGLWNQTSRTAPDQWNAPEQPKSLSLVAVFGQSSFKGPWGSSRGTYNNEIINFPVSDDVLEAIIGFCRACMVEENFVCMSWSDTAKRSLRTNVY